MEIARELRRDPATDAWNLDSADRAARVLERLAKSLECDHPGAAASST